MPTTLDSVNLAVLLGPCSGPPDVRALESGRRLATLAVRVPGAAGRATSVPVSVWDPPAWLETVGPGDELVVVGRVRRRFFRTAAGGTGSKVDVDADLVGRARDRRRVANARRRAEAALAGFEEAQDASVS